MQTEAAVANRRGARARKNSDGQEAIIETSVVGEKIHYLIGLKQACESASTDYSDAIKAVAEKAGIQSSVLRKFVDARAGDNFTERKRDAFQLNLVFESVGE